MVDQITATLGELNARRGDYDDDVQHLGQIRTLFTGGREIEKRKRDFLHRRLDESPEEYGKRLERFVYTNHFGYAVQRLLSKFSTGQIHVLGIPDSALPDWSLIRENIGVGKQDEKLFLQDLLRRLVIDGAVWIRADRPASPEHITNRTQERALGLRPYLVAYSPLEVLAYGDGWVKLRRFSRVQTPFGGERYEARWEVITNETTTTFTLPVLLNDSGEIRYVLTADGKKPYNEKIPLSGTSVAHGFGRLPLSHIELPPESWAGNQVRLKALQHLQIENALTDSAVSAGYVQRVLTPLEETENLAELTVEEEPVSSNSRILRAKSFEFAEIAGSSIRTNAELLEKIGADIRSTVQVTGASVDKAALERSAASKYADREELSLALIGYGQLIAAVYQDALQMIAPLMDVRPSELAVTGLDAFELDNLREDLEVGEKLVAAKLESRISPVALRSFYQRLGTQLSPNASALQRQEIEQTTPESSIGDDDTAK